MFIAALLIVARNWKQPKCFLVAQCLNCDTSWQWNIIQHEKKMSYQALKRHGGILNAHY